MKEKEDYYPCVDELRDAWINDADHGMPPESMEISENPESIDRPNCGRLLIDCNGNCIFDDRPNKGFGQDLSAVPVLAEPIAGGISIGTTSEVGFGTCGEARESTTFGCEEIRTGKPEMADSRGGAQSFSEPEGLKAWIDEVEARWWDNPQNQGLALPTEENMESE